MSAFLSVFVSAGTIDFIEFRTMVKKAMSDESGGGRASGKKGKNGLFCYGHFILGLEILNVCQDRLGTQTHYEILKNRGSRFLFLFLFVFIAS